MFGGRAEFDKAINYRNTIFWAWLTSFEDYLNLIMKKVIKPVKEKNDIDRFKKFWM